MGRRRTAGGQIGSRREAFDGAVYICVVVVTEDVCLIIGHIGAPSTNPGNLVAPHSGTHLIEMIIAPPESLVTLLKPWADFYSHSKVAETIVTFLHIGGLLLAGGLAIAADRSTVRALRLAAEGKQHFVEELGTVHRWVLTGLTVVMISGVAMLAADVETFFGSWVFWVKMVLVALLLINGVVMTRAESALKRDAGESAPAWATLHRTAVTSLGFWFVITLAGVALVNVS